MRAQAQIDIAASEREVWTVVADIASWPTWNPAVRQAVFTSDLDVGSRFRYATALGATTCRLTLVDAPRALAWKGRLLTMLHRQVWRVERGPSGTAASAHASLSGLGAWLFRRRLTERLQGELDALVQLLKLEAEARASEERADEAQAAAAGAQDT